MRLSVDKINFAYGQHHVLQDVSFDAEDNTVISVLGSNGAGKSTLLKCMTNILRPRSGSVLIDGTGVLDLSGKELARHIGYVPQSVPVSRMTVFDAVLMGRKPHIKLAVTEEDLEITGAVIEAMGLAPLALNYLDRISGGEFQKVQIARAIAQEPQILILDEPSNNLDISNQHRTMAMVEQIVRSKGVCTIMTMHDINLAIHYSDKFLFMRDGRVEAYGGVEVITEDLVRRVYGIDSEIIDHRGVPFVVPGNSSRYREAETSLHKSS